MNKYKSFEVKSDCCKAKVEFVKTHNVGYPKCVECGKQCNFKEPKSKNDKFDYFLTQKKEGLDYYEDDAQWSLINHKKMELIAEIRKEWMSIFFTN